MSGEALEDGTPIRRIAECGHGHLFTAVYQPWGKDEPTEYISCIDTDSLEEALRKGSEILEAVRERGTLRGYFLVTPTGAVLPSVSEP